MASARLAWTLGESDNALLALSAQVGTSTSAAAPQTAPTRLPVPPRMTPVSSATDRLSGKAPGATSEVTTTSNPPASPAEAELTTKAVICVRATWKPASCAATSSSRTARNARP